jgi:orotate phosphoribosyltransferase
MKTKLLQLLKHHSLKVGSFKLSSQRESAYYIDCKPTILTADGHHMVGHLMNELINDHIPHITNIAAVELGGCPIASSISLISVADNLLHHSHSKKNALYIRKQEKSHGTKNLIEGLIPNEGTQIVLIEDVITTGKSSIKALNVLIDNGFTPTGVFSIVDRLEGGKENIEHDFRIPVVSLFTIKDLIDG